MESKIVEEILKESGLKVSISACLVSIEVSAFVRISTTKLYHNWNWKGMDGICFSAFGFIDGYANSKTKCNELLKNESLIIISQ